MAILMLLGWVLLFVNLGISNASFEHIKDKATFIHIRPLATESLMLGGVLKRRCSATTPGWNAIWHDDKGLQVAGDTLVIENLRPGPMMTYNCILSKNNIRIMKTMSYAVQEHQPVSVRKSELIPMCSTKRNYTIIACKHPVVKQIYWLTVCGKKIAGDLLEIDHSLGDQSGVYTCVAENGWKRTYVDFVLANPEADEKAVIKVANAVITKVGKEKLVIGGFLHRRCIAPFPCILVSWSYPDGSIREETDLILSPIKKSDLGTYKCSFSFLFANEPVEKIIAITADSKDVIETRSTDFIVEPKSLNFNENGKLLLKCLPPKGMERDKAIWYLKHDVSYGNNELIFRSLPALKTGSYTCRVFDKKEGTKYETINVVHSREKQSNIKILIYSVTGDGLVYRGSIRRICKVYSPNWYVQWYYPDGYTASGDYKSMAIIVDNLQSKNNGQYTCIAKRNGEILKASFIVNIKDIFEQKGVKIEILQGDNLVQGGRLHRKCISKHLSKKSVWILPDGSQHDKQVLNILHLQSYNNGRYTCQGVNDNSSSWFILALTTREKGKINILLLNGDDIAESGAIMRRGEVNGYISGTTVFWTLPDGNRRNGHDISIPALQTTNNGVYTFEARSRTGIILGRKSFYVNINRPKDKQEKPRIIIKVLPKNSEVFGGELARECVVNEKGWDTYWILPNGTRYQSSKIAIPDLQRADNGRYICNAIEYKTGVALSNWIDVVVVSENSKTKVIPEVKIHTSPSESLNLSIIYFNDMSDIPTKTGATVQVHCLTNDNGWEFSWIIPRPIHKVSTGSYLAIPNFQVQNTGLYACIAEKKGRKLKKTLYIEINGNNDIVLKYNTLAKIKTKNGSIIVSTNPTIGKWKIEYTKWKTAMGRVIKGQNFTEKGEDVTGSYECIVYDDSDNMLITQFYLSTGGDDKVARIYIDKVGDDSLKIGGSIHRLCRSTSALPVEIFWISPTGKRTKSQDLIIKDLSPKETGLYTCHAVYIKQNRIITQKSFYLKISDDEVVDFLDSIKVPKNQKVRIGKIAVYFCKAPLNKGKWKVSWESKQENEKLFHGSELKLKIDDKYSGEYICTASSNEIEVKESLNLISSPDLVGYEDPTSNNNAETRTSDSVTFEAATISDIVPFGGTLNFRCKVKGSDWRKRLVDDDDRQIKNDELTLQNVQANEKGNYKCIFEKDNLTIIQSVQVVPENKVLKIRFSQVKYSKEGEDVEVLICKPPTQEKWKINWTTPCKNDIKGDRIHINTMSIEGFYNCTAQLGKNIITNSFQLKRRNQEESSVSVVKVEVEKVGSDDGNTDGKIELRCNVISKCAMRIEWTTPQPKEHYDIRGPHITIENDDVKNSGFYVCRASNPNILPYYAVASDRVLLKINKDKTEFLSPKITGEIQGTQEGLDLTCEGPDGWTSYWLNKEDTLKPSPKLMIRNPDKDDSGSYKCISFKGEDHIRNKIYVKVIKPYKVKESIKKPATKLKDKLNGEPVVTDLPIDTVVITNSVILSTPEVIPIESPLHIRCKPKGDGWTSWWISKNGTQISNEIISFSNVKKEDAGVYKCVSGQYKIRVVQTIHIIVTKDKVQILAIETKHQFINKKLVFTCETLDKTRQWTVYWITKCGQRQNGSKLVIENPREDGIFKCVGKAGEITLVNHVYVKRDNANVTVSPVSVLGVKVEIIGVDNKTIGGRMHRRCIGVTSCPVTVKWIYPNKTEVKSQYLFLNKLSEADKGKYICVVTDTLNKIPRKVNQTFYVEIKGGKVKPLSPRIKGSEISPEEDFDYSCLQPENGKGWDTFWIAPNDTKIEKTELKRSDLETDDSGSYTCVNKKGDTTLTDTIDISVIKPIKGKIGTLPDRSPQDKLGYVSRIRVSFYPKGAVTRGGNIKVLCGPSHTGWDTKWIEPKRQTIHQTNVLYLRNVTSERIAFCEIHGKGVALLHAVWFLPIFNKIQPLTLTVLPSKNNTNFECRPPNTCRGWKTYWMDPCFRKISDNGTLQLTKNMRDGIYFCTATLDRFRLKSHIYIRRNKGGRVASNIPTIKSVGPSPPKIGGRFHLRCETNGHCPRDFIWILPNQTKRIGPDLIIQQFKGGNFGKYECITSDFSSTISKSVLLDRDDDEIMLITSNVTGSTEVEDGRILKIRHKCEISGNEKDWKIHWLDRNRFPIPSIYLNFQKVNALQNGVYFCVLTKGTLKMIDSIFYKGSERVAGSTEMLIPQETHVQPRKFCLPMRMSDRGGHKPSPTGVTGGKRHGMGKSIDQEKYFPKFVKGTLPNEVYIIEGDFSQVWAASTPHEFFIRVVYREYNMQDLKMDCGIEPLQKYPLTKGNFCFKFSNGSNYCLEFLSSFDNAKRSVELNLGNTLYIKGKFDKYTGGHVILTANYFPNVNFTFHCSMENDRGKITSNNVRFQFFNKIPLINKIYRKTLPLLIKNSPSMIPGFDYDIPYTVALEWMHNNGVPNHWNYQIKPFVNWPMQVLRNGSMYTPFFTDEAIRSLQGKYLTLGFGQRAFINIKVGFPYNLASKYPPDRRPWTHPSMIYENTTVRVMNISGFYSYYRCNFKIGEGTYDIKWRKYDSDGDNFQYLKPGMNRRYGGVQVENSLLTVVSPLSSDAPGRYMCEVNYKSSTGKKFTLIGGYNLVVDNLPQISPTFTDKVIPPGGTGYLNCEFLRKDAIPSIAINGILMDLRSELKLKESIKKVNKKYEEFMEPLEVRIVPLNPKVGDKIVYSAFKMKETDSKTNKSSIHFVDCIGQSKFGTVRKRAFLKVADLATYHMLKNKANLEFTDT